MLVSDSPKISNLNCFMNLNNPPFFFPYLKLTVASFGYACLLGVVPCYPRVVFYRLGCHSLSDQWLLGL